MTHSQSLRRLARPPHFNAAVPPRPPISAPLPKDSVDGAVYVSGGEIPRHGGPAGRLPDGPPGRSLAESIRGPVSVHIGGARVHFHGGVPRPTRASADRDFVFFGSDPRTLFTFSSARWTRARQPASAVPPRRAAALGRRWRHQLMDTLRSASPLVLSTPTAPRVSITRRAKSARRRTTKDVATTASSSRVGAARAPSCSWARTRQRPALTSAARA